ncbi:high-affinity iron permease [Colletotrichum fioriniae]|uniref:high-affinity iron permease n=1 Tax=Colletotrichum fioriniae TaxID=710243 RepID=UPI0032DAD8C1|nr:high-affinity iron permease [Colletotrichum fioriniae]
MDLCCSPELNGGGGWGIFNAVLGWTNSATYGSVISYNVYWIFVIGCFLLMRFHETKGHWPLMKAKAPREVDRRLSDDRSGSEQASTSEKDKGAATTKTVTASS